MDPGHLSPERVIRWKQSADPGDLSALLVPRERVWSNQLKLHNGRAFKINHLRPISALEASQKHQGQCQGPQDGILVKHDDPIIA
jgi:hypothetical protein